MFRNKLIFISTFQNIQYHRQVCIEYQVHLLVILFEKKQKLLVSCNYLYSLKIFEQLVLYFITELFYLYHIYLHKHKIANLYFY